MKTVIFILFLLMNLNVGAQSVIKGKVTNEKGESIPGVNIYLENTYDGGTSDSTGYFKFKTSEKGKQLLSATFLGYQKWQKGISLDTANNPLIILKESVKTLDAVIIIAGSFAAGDEKRAAIMKSLDIYTTASANGDIMGAMRTMPGTQAAADDGRLLVRGGDAYETHTYIDGLLAAKPYYSKTPDIATRGRFAPSLFSGVVFNSGGYSAEYGQALSSVLILNSNDLPDEDLTSFSLMSIGGEMNHTKRWKSGSLSLSGSYTNFTPYRKLFISSVDWEKPVSAASFSAVFRDKTKSNGMLKGYVTTNLGKMAYNVPTGISGQQMKIANDGTTVYSNFSFRDCFSEKACYKIGVSSTYQNEKLKVGSNDIETNQMNIDARFNITHELKEGVLLTYGINETFNRYNQSYKPGTGSNFKTNFEDHLVGVFAETEIMFSKNFAVRPGLRSEYSSVIKKMNLEPRFSVAMKTGKDAQVSAAWGLYHQTPQEDYLKLNKNLGFERAIHYILGYQSGDMASRLFRTEAYYKTYQNLITYSGNNYYIPNDISNSGNGYAGGLDIFWRDRKSIKGFDYWITYSYVDTKRKYKDYPVKATPDFVSKHNFSIVGKYWLAKISTQAGFSFTAASGRPYNDPNGRFFMDQKAKPYSDLSLNLSHIFYIGNQYSVLYCSVTNVLGRDNVFGYRPSGIADAQGDYSLIPVKQDLKRMVFIGLFLNL